MSDFRDSDAALIRKHAQLIHDIGLGSKELRDHHIARLTKEQTKGIAAATRYALHAGHISDHHLRTRGKTIKHMIGRNTSIEKKRQAVQGQRGGSFFGHLFHKIAHGLKAAGHAISHVAGKVVGGVEHVAEKIPGVKQAVGLADKVGNLAVKGVEDTAKLGAGALRKVGLGKVVNAAEKVGGAALKTVGKIQSIPGASLIEDAAAPEFFDNPAVQAGLAAAKGYNKGGARGAIQGAAQSLL